MNIRTWPDGLSRLVIEREPDGRVRFSVHDKDREGFAATVSRADAAAVAAFVYQVELFETRPEDHRRDQYDPRDFVEERF